MARFSGTEIIYAAAESWRDNCLIADGSIFGDQKLWTAAHVAELVKDFIENPDLGDQNFETKMAGQLEHSSPAGKQLASEMLWVMVLFPSQTGQATKIAQVRNAWALSGSSLNSAHPQLGAVLANGVGHVGTAFNTMRWRELGFLIRLAERLKELEKEGRAHLLADPWRFSEWLVTVEDGDRRQLRHVLLHLLFPDSFERIASGAARSELYASFASLIDDEDLPTSDDLLTRMDQQILAIRRVLEEQHPTTPIDFYEGDIRGRWIKGKHPVPPVPEPARPPKGVRETLQSRIWVIGAGRGATRWQTFYEDGLVAIGWEKLGDMRRFDTRESLKRALQKAYKKDRDPTNDSLACWQFSRDMQIGDEILVKQSRDRILGYGVVEGPYEFNDKLNVFNHVRRVRWLNRGNWLLPESARLPTKTLTEVSGYPKFVEHILPLMKDSRPNDDQPFTVDHALVDAFLDRSKFEELLASLRRRKNLILQGSPGVGKSFLARRLAYALIGARKPEQVQMIQFHQSYAYEDFIQGWRPNGSGGFTRKNGVFYNFCRKAQGHPERTYVFVIDEINRGNLSKVFGELFFLLEADKRGPDNAIPLTYSESETETFHVPANVYVLGLMNTADRSLAMVDYALRRRFAFATLHPEFESPRFREIISKHGVSHMLIDRIIERVSQVNAEIIGDDKALGAGFTIGHSYFCPPSDMPDPESWYMAVVQQELRPLLEEYWFDNPQRVEKCMQILVG